MTGTRVQGFAPRVVTSHQETPIDSTAGLIDTLLIGTPSGRSLRGVHRRLQSSVQRIRVRGLSDLHDGWGVIGRGPEVSIR
jgi:hypothetical protein